MGIRSILWILTILKEVYGVMGPNFLANLFSTLYLLRLNILIVPFSIMLTPAQ